LGNCACLNSNFVNIKLFARQFLLPYTTLNRPQPPPSPTCLPTSNCSLPSMTCMEVRGMNATAALAPADTDCCSLQRSPTVLESQRTLDQKEHQLYDAPYQPMTALTDLLTALTIFSVMTLALRRTSSLQSPLVLWPTFPKMVCSRSHDVPSRDWD